MREVTVPPIVTVSDTATLTDPVWDNAEQFPNEPQFAIRTGSGWRDVTCAQFRADVLAVARGLIAAGVAPGSGSR